MSKGSGKTPDPGKRRALGRGLSALLPSTPPAGAGPATGGSGSRSFFHAQIEEVHPSPDQPRRIFAEEDLEELAQSIRTYDIIQPLAVRKRKEGGYWLIAGERRWRAAQRAGKHAVPVVVHQVTERESFERALVENLQRADLNAIETARAYQHIIDDLDYTQDELGERVGKDRSSIANSLRLLKLPISVQTMVEEDSISMGHARALLAAGNKRDIEAMARAVVKQKLSVRATEKLVKQRAKPAAATKKTSKKSASVRDLENRLTKALGAPVAVVETGKGGRLEIRYSDLDALDRLLDQLL